MARLASLAHASVLLAVVVTASGCPDHGGGDGMIVLANTAPTGTTCAFTGDPAQPTLAQGIIEATSPEPYVLSPLVESRITVVNGEDAARTIILSGADVTLSKADASGNLSQIAQYTALLSGAIPPATDANVPFAVIPTSVLMTFATSTTDVTLAADVTIFGNLGGGRIDATPFRYSVTVCNGCIVNKIGDCASFTATVRTGNPCNPFQDGVVDCCTNDGDLVCPAVME